QDRRLAADGILEDLAHGSCQEVPARGPRNCCRNCGEGRLRVGQRLQCRLYKAGRTPPGTFWTRLDFTADWESGQIGNPFIRCPARTAQGKGRGHRPDEDPTTPATDTQGDPDEQEEFLR